MKKTNQTNAQKFRLGFLKTLVLTSAMCVSANVASAQTDASLPTNVSAQSREPNNKKEYYQQQQTMEQTPRPVPVEKRTPTAADSKPISAMNKANDKPDDATSKQMQPVSMEQLMLQKKQAHDKGMPTDEYDNAIKNRIKNQTN